MFNKLYKNFFFNLSIKLGTKMGELNQTLFYKINSLLTFMCIYNISINLMIL